MTKKSAAVIVLGQKSIPVAKKIISVIPEAKLYGLANRTTDVDISFTEFGTTLRELFASGVPIIGICATGILIRTLAPMLSNKRFEPPIIAVAEDGSAVVPLLGGLNGVNNLARQISAVLDVKAAITTTGDIRFGIALEDPPSGYFLANPEDAKTFMSDLLAGNSVRIEGHAPWLEDSLLPLDHNAERVIVITENKIPANTSLVNTLIYHPKTLAIGVGHSCTELNQDITITNQTLTKEEVIKQTLKNQSVIKQMLEEANLAWESIGGIFASEVDAANPNIQALATALNLPVRFFSKDELNILMSQNNIQDIATSAALNATSGELIIQKQTSNINLDLSFNLNLNSGLNSELNSEVKSQLTSNFNLNFAIAKAALPIDINTIGKPRGRLAIIGTGPGSSDWMSPEVKEILSSATDFVGYSTYINLVSDFTKGKKIHESDNREEISRAKKALELATEGRFVVVVSSGDPGIYAMAAAVFEVLDTERLPQWQGIDIQVAPGISAMQAAAARIGAPLGHDFCTISLSDILKPWSIIEQRIMAAAQGDFVIAFYNPVSKQRTWQLTETKNILLRYRSPDTPVIVARNVGRNGESITVCNLSELSVDRVDMRCLVLIGSSQTRIVPKLDGKVWVYTPRRYDKCIS
jgi:cobalt-precorrin 5A hydrolase / precorrin-3B C17-methyltransferase